MPKRILLADDSLTIQKVVELTFSDSDFELTSVSNGQRALEKIREERPDLILADVVMPEKNGYEVCEAIKGNPATAKIPVVLLSGTFEPFDRERAERIGADAIVSKPFDSQQLLSQVEALLARASRDAASATTVVVPMSSMTAEPEPPGPPPLPIRQATEPIAKPADEPPPFEAGFTAEDFTGTIRLPSTEQTDPFEEEYGRAGVDSAIEAFEKSQSAFTFASAESEIEIDDERFTGKTVRPASDAAPEVAPTRFLAEEPEKMEPFESPAAAPAPRPEAFDLWGAADSSSRVAPPPPSEVTVAIRHPLASGPGETVALKGPLEAPVDVAPAAPAATPAPAAAKAAGKPEQPQELEALASGTTIPELTEMLSTVSRGNGELSEADLDRLAAKVVEKLSEKIVREIAWEVIPDMAEIVIKQRIKELESGVE